MRNLYRRCERPTRTILVALLCAGLGGACGGGKPKAASPDVWATVDGHEIRREEVEKAYRTAMDPSVAQPTDVEQMGAKLDVLEQLINQQILLARAAASKLAATDAEVDKAYQERKGTNEAVFQAQLLQRGLSADDMKTAVRRELTIQKVIDRDIGPKIAVTDREIGDFYTANRDKFNVAEAQYHIAQIVITPVREPQITNRQHDDAATPADADRKAQMLMEKLKGGASFSDLAMDYSEDAGTAPRGGDLGFVSASALGRVPPQLRDAVLQSQPGTVKTVSAGGAHTLVLLIATEAAGQRQLTDPGVKDQISESLRQRKDQVLRSAYIAAARNDTKIVNYFAQQIVDAQGPLPNLAPAVPGKK